MTINQFNQILASYLKQGIKEAIIKFDNTGIIEVEPLQSTDE